MMLSIKDGTVDLTVPQTDTEFEDSQFQLFKKFEIVVPQNFEYSTCLGALSTMEDIFYVSPYFTDEKFSHATMMFVVGQKILVKIFKIDKTVDSAVCLRKVFRENGILLGAQGISLFGEKKNRAELPKGFWYLSFDEKNALPVVDGKHRVPYIGVCPRGQLGFDVRPFEGKWFEGDYLICFCLATVFN